jgi:hypothetical protein
MAHVKSTIRPMTSKELPAASLPPAEEEVQELRSLNIQKKTQLLMDLGTARREKSDLREKILKMWMLILKISLPRNAQSLSLRLLFSMNPKSLQI